MKSKKILSLVLSMIFVFGCFASTMAVGASAAGNAWDGKTANIKWYVDHKNEKTFTIKTAEDLYGLSVLVEVINHKPASLRGDGEIFYDANGKIITDENEINVTSLSVTGSKFAGCTIYLDADIDLGSHPFRPIGSSSSFQGMFDGNFHTIKNLYIDTATAKHATLQHYYMGLFAITYTTNAGVRNLKLENVKYDFMLPAAATKAVIGGISGQGHKGGSTISNCRINGLEINISAEAGASRDIGVGAIYGDFATSFTQKDNIITGYKLNIIDNYANIVTDQSNLFGVVAETTGAFESSTVYLQGATVPSDIDANWQANNPAPAPEPGTDTDKTTDKATDKATDKVTNKETSKVTNKVTNKVTDKATEAATTNATTNQGGENEPADNTVIIIIAAVAAAAVVAVVVIVVIKKKKQ